MTRLEQRVRPGVRRGRMNEVEPPTRYNHEVHTDDLNRLGDEAMKVFSVQV